MRLMKGWLILGVLLTGCGSTGTSSPSSPSDDSAAKAAYMSIVSDGLTTVGDSMTATGKTCDSGTLDECSKAIGDTRTKVEDLTAKLDKQSTPAALAKGDTDFKKGLRDTTAALDQVQQAFSEVDTTKEDAASTALGNAEKELSTASSELASE